MANGSFTGTTTNSLTSVRIVWSAESDAASNTSRVSASLQLYKNAPYASRTYGTGSWTLTVDGESITKKVTVSLYRDAGWVTVAQMQKTIAHDASGAKSISISASGGISGTTLSSISCSRTVALDTIDRASELEILQTDVPAGEEISFRIEPANEEVTHKVIFSIGDFREELIPDSLEGTFAIPMDWCQAIPSAVSGVLTCTLETYFGDTRTGVRKKELNLLVPDTLRPTLETVTAQVIDGAWDLFVQNKSRCSFHFQNASGAQGSSIVSYLVTSLAPSSQDTLQSEILTASGEVTYTCHVVDSRGRQSEPVTCSIFVHPYAKPTLHASVYRCDASGQPDSDGAHLLVQADFACSELEGNNIATCFVRWKNTASQTQSDAVALQSGIVSVVGDGTVDPAASHDVEFTLTDTLGAQVTYLAHIAPSFRLINANAAMGGIAFGRMSNQKALQCAMDAVFEKDVTVEGDLIVNGAFSFAGQTSAQIDPLTLMPIGYVYISAEATSPAELFGGTWEALEDVFLLAASGSYPAGSRGGEAAHTLALTEIPSHMHQIYGMLSSSSGGSGAFNYYRNAPNEINFNTYPNCRTQYSGGGKAHNNMPPYLAVHMWQRIA